MNTLVLLLVALWPALWLIRQLYVTRLLLGLEFRRERIVPLTAGQIPFHMMEAAGMWRAELEAQGFTFLGGWQVQRFSDPSLDEVEVVLTQPGRPMRAIIRSHGESARAGECWVALRTTTAEGREIVTASFSPEPILPRHAAIDFTAVAVKSAAELLAQHQARIAAVADTAWQCVDIAGAAQREQYLADASFLWVDASGQLAARETGALSFRVGAAFRRARELTRHAAAQKKAKAGRPPPKPAAISPEAQVEFDWQQYRQIGAITRGKLSTRTKAVISLVSFVLFAIAIGWGTSPTVSITLLVALVVHEGGHLLAMRWFGFRDTQLLFIPFFGGAAVGHDDKVLRPWQHIVIILMGPLPGLFVGMGMLAWGSGGAESGWWFQAAVTTVSLNAFNLLPILPLDGGQIVDFAIASRFPRARVLFLAASAVGLLLLALVFDGVKLLFGLAVVTLIRLPIEWKQAVLRREVRAEFPEGAEEEPIVRRLLVGMRESQWAKVAMVQRLQMTRALQNVLRMPRPGLGTMCFAVAGYTAPLWCGAPLAMWASYRRGEAAVERAEQAARTAGLTTRSESPAAPRVPEAENAAVLYAQVEALSAGKPAPRASKEDEAKALELLRAASRRRVFAPVKTEGGEARLRWMLGGTHGAELGRLTNAAEARLQYHEPLVAADYAIDALRLVRLMDAAPGWWSWREHRGTVEQSWKVIEQVGMSGVALPPAMIANLLELLDEKREVAFAAEAIPIEMVRDARAMDELLASGKGAERHPFWFAVARVMTGTARTQVAGLQHAVTLHQQMQQIRGGQWPEFTEAASDEALNARLELGRFADLLARMRQARAALLVVERRQHGVEISSLGALGEAEKWAHPWTAQPMQWAHRGAVDVLTFAKSTPRGMELAGETDLVWRLPAN